MSFLKPLCVAALFALPLSASAQTDTGTDQAAAATVTNGQKFGAWTVACVAVAVGKTNCTLTQRILRATDSAFVADIIATRNDKDETYLIARVPVGVFLPNGFAMREAENQDEKAVMSFTWQACNRDFCEALLQVDTEKATALSAQDNEMVAAFRPNAQSDPFLFKLSLNGMASGLDAIRP
ncbi:invasion associated locus B family protein [Sulfitobacter sp. F26204]|uniref:invasion associated locus B family protein n=1 Tax=Sulfitobacter sp. F26204 TaxID=2996014 RepID=UPI00225E3DFD|nr:invasion associated locus B family protein [Sulfitobacter sp. F26204]MCX7561581.1 invasion associated locus B family protein [Sulfitobacter sp. F26204]